jgi:hypothetical protein
MNYFRERLYNELGRDNIAPFNSIPNEILTFNIDPKIEGPIEFNDHECIAIAFEMALCIAQKIYDTYEDKYLFDAEFVIIPKPREYRVKFLLFKRKP